MDLNKLKTTKDFVEVIITDLEGDPILREDGVEMYISVYGPYSKEFKKAEYDQANEMIKSRSRKGKIKVTAQDVERNGLNILAAVTKDWNIVVDGQELPCTFDNAVKVYKEYPAVAEQVQSQIEDVSAFMGT